MRVLARLFLAIFLAFAFAVLGATVSPGVSSAEDVWAYSSEYGDDYVMTETISKCERGIELNVKRVKDGEVHIDPVIFTKHNTWCGLTSTGMRDVGLVSWSKYASAVWNVVKNYL